MMERERKTQAIRCTSCGEAIDQFTYDERGRLATHIDPKGALTQWLYDDTNSHKTTIDPLQNASFESYDE